jgi:hypothetical protein
MGCAFIYLQSTRSVIRCAFMYLQGLATRRLGLGIICSNTFKLLPLVRRRHCLQVPSILAEVFPAVAAAGPASKLFVSICAGVTLEVGLRATHIRVRRIVVRRIVGAIYWACRLSICRCVSVASTNTYTSLTTSLTPYLTNPPPNRWLRARYPAAPAWCGPCPTRRASWAKPRWGLRAGLRAPRAMRPSPRRSSRWVWVGVDWLSQGYITSVSTAPAAENNVDPTT